MGSAGGGEKLGLHLKDKFFQTIEDVEMGAWGITERESDYGLDLLGTIVATKLKVVDFATFNVAEAMDVITADIMEEISVSASDKM